MPSHGLPKSVPTHRSRHVRQSHRAAADATVADSRWACSPRQGSHSRRDCPVARRACSARRRTSWARGVVGWRGRRRSPRRNCHLACGSRHWAAWAGVVDSRRLRRWARRHAGAQDSPPPPTRRAHATRYQSQMRPACRVGRARGDARRGWAAPDAPNVGWDARAVGRAGQRRHARRGGCAPRVAAPAPACVAAPARSRGLRRSPPAAPAPRRPAAIRANRRLRRLAPV